MRRCFLWLLLIAMSATAPATQTLVRRATTIDALRAYPGFFHMQPVVLVGELRREGERLMLVTDVGVLTVVSREPLGEGVMEVRGFVYDIGRLGQDDPRLNTLDLRGDIERQYGDRWPRPGEELILQATSAVPPAASPNLAAPPLRAVALTPERFIGQRISIVGQFRGRNLFGDLPAGPGVDRWDFVVRTTDAAIWVTGQRPRGRDFDLDVARRMDTGRWLRVTGTVAAARGLVWIEATAVAAAEDPGEAVVEVEVEAPPPPPLEVIFTSPREGELTVAPDARLRLQFSRDLAPDSIAGQLRVGYVQPGGAPEPIAFTVEYNAASRGIEIVPAAPLAPFRTVVVEVLEGLTAFDGTSVTPFTLRFDTGG